MARRLTGRAGLGGERAELGASRGSWPGTRAPPPARRGRSSSRARASHGPAWSGCSSSALRSDGSSPCRHQQVGLARGRREPVDELGHLGLGEGPDEAVDDLAVPQGEHGGDRLDLERGGDPRVLVHVDLDQLDLSRRWRRRPARGSARACGRGRTTAPRGRPRPARRGIERAPPARRWRRLRPSSGSTLPVGAHGVGWTAMRQLEPVACTTMPDAPTVSSQAVPDGHRRSGPHPMVPSQSAGGRASPAVLAHRRGTVQPHVPGGGRRGGSPRAAPSSRQPRPADGARHAEGAPPADRPVADGGTGAPTLGLCTDPAVNGAPFYVMEFVDGHILRNAGAAESAFPSAAEVADRRPSRRHARRCSIGSTSTPSASAIWRAATGTSSARCAVGPSSTATARSIRASPGLGATTWSPPTSSWRGSARSSPSASHRNARPRSCTATTASTTSCSATTGRCWRSSTGSCARSATPLRTSGSCSCYWAEPGESGTVLGQDATTAQGFSTAPGHRRSLRRDLREGRLPGRLLHGLRLLEAGLHPPGRLRAVREGGRPRRREHRRRALPQIRVLAERAAESLEAVP